MGFIGSYLTRFELRNVIVSLLTQKFSSWWNLFKTNTYIFSVQLREISHLVFTFVSVKMPSSHK